MEVVLDPWPGLEGHQITKRGDAGQELHAGRGSSVVRHSQPAWRTDVGGGRASGRQTGIQPWRSVYVAGGRLARRLASGR